MEHVTMPSPPIAYRFREHVELQEHGESICARSPFFQVTISRLSPTFRSILLELAHNARSTQWIHESVLNAPENTSPEQTLPTFYRYLSSLLRHQMISITAGGGTDDAPLATLTPISSHFQHRLVLIQPKQAYKMSRFAYLRRDEDDCYVMESPLAHAVLRFEAPAALDLISQLNQAVPASQLTQARTEAEQEQRAGLLTLLVMGDFVFPVTSEGRFAEDEDEALMQWEFHDLLFHSRSRTGRHSNPLGGTFRFLHQLPPQPVVKQGQWLETIALPYPDMKQICAEDPTLATVMEERVSIRDYDGRPLTIAQLSEFLYRVARIKEITHYEEFGEVTRRPYPGSGASYELELYLTIDQCEGLKPGFYWYDPLNHQFSFIQSPNKYTEKLLDEATQAMGGEARPQVLITLAARFQRVSWKYQSIAYALILKDVGVLYATMYLVATAMGLAPCAQGVGDSDCFARLAGTNYLKETSVGEFTLGRKPA